MTLGDDHDFLERTLRFYGIMQPRKVLDFGCGKGASTAVLRQMYPTAFIDFMDLDRDFWFQPYDLIVLSAVYEHMMISERIDDMQMVWSALSPGGHLVICRTPHRWALWDGHTTGMPGMAFLPDCLAKMYATAGRKKFRNYTWEQLLRAGIRGGTIRQIMKQCPGGELIPGARRLWLELSGERRLRWLKRLMPMQSINICIRKPK